MNGGKEGDIGDVVGWKLGRKEECRCYENYGKRRRNEL